MNRTAIALFALGIVASFWLLEGAFAAGDHRKAQALVREHRLGGPTLEQFLLSRHADRTGPPAWSSHILSGCRGFVRVRCAIPRRGAAPAAYVFDVDLPQKGIHPADEAGRSVLREFARAGSSPPRAP